MINSFVRHVGKSAFLTLISLSMALSITGCAARQKKATVKELKELSEKFVRHFRWGDFNGVAKILVPEQRLSFVKGVLERQEDQSLKILDFEMEHVHFDPSGNEAIILSKISWYRLPSVTTKSEVVTLHFEERDGEWFVSAMDNGPIPIEKMERPKESKGDTEKEEMQPVSESFEKIR